MKLIPTWRRWWRRHSVQVLALIPIIEALQRWVPSIREFMGTDSYGFLYGAISLTAVVLMQIKQDSVSGSK